MVQTKPMTVSQVADVFSVSIATVREWADTGKLPDFRTPGNQRRFPREAVERFIKDQAAA